MRWQTCNLDENKILASNLLSRTIIYLILNVISKLKHMYHLRWNPYTQKKLRWNPIASLQTFVAFFLLPLPSSKPPSFVLQLIPCAPSSLKLSSLYLLQSFVIPSWNQDFFDCNFGFCNGFDFDPNNLENFRMVGGVMIETNRNGWSSNVAKLLLDLCFPFLLSIFAS